jgi:hypothetical protein
MQNKLCLSNAEAVKGDFKVNVVLIQVYIQMERLQVQVTAGSRET